MKIFKENFDQLFDKALRTTEKKTEVSFSGRNVLEKRLFGRKTLVLNYRWLTIPVVALAVVALILTKQPSSINPLSAQEVLAKAANFIPQPRAGKVLRVTRISEYPQFHETSENTNIANDLTIGVTGGADLDDASIINSSGVVLSSTLIEKEEVLTDGQSFLSEKFDTSNTLISSEWTDFDNDKFTFTSIVKDFLAESNNSDGISFVEMGDEGSGRMTIGNFTFLDGGPLLPANDSDSFDPIGEITDFFNSLRKETKGNLEKINEELPISLTEQKGVWAYDPLTTLLYKSVPKRLRNFLNGQSFCEANECKNIYIKDIQLGDKKEINNQSAVSVKIFLGLPEGDPACGTAVEKMIENGVETFWLAADDYRILESEFSVKDLVYGRWTYQYEEISLETLPFAFSQKGWLNYRDLNNLSVIETVSGLTAEEAERDSEIAKFFNIKLSDKVDGIGYSPTLDIKFNDENDGLTGMTIF